MFSLHVIIPVLPALFPALFPHCAFKWNHTNTTFFTLKFTWNFICLLSVYLYVKRYFRGKPQTSFGILISIGDTSRKEKRRYAICSAAFFIIDILCKFVYRRISAIISVFGSSFFKEEKLHIGQLKFFCILSTEAPDCGSNHKLQGFLPDDAALHKSLSQMSELLIENRTALATDAPVAVHSEIKWKP